MRAEQADHSRCRDLPSCLQQFLENSMTRSLTCLGLILLLSVSVPGEDEKTQVDRPVKKTGTEKQTDKPQPQAIAIFDGKTLSGWKATNFGGEAEVSVKDGAILLPVGNDMTGITWKDASVIPRTGYILELEAQRVDGSDFFCGLTFPVGKDPCSLILGGWGGGVCGLSSINGFDASENETTVYREFENKKWYRVRLQVCNDRIQVWLDKKNIVDQPRKDRMFSIRLECELSLPLGFATWRTSGALRKLKLRRMTAEEQKTAQAEHLEKLKDE